MVPALEAAIGHPGFFLVFNPQYSVFRKVRLGGTLGMCLPRARVPLLLPKKRLREEGNFLRSHGFTETDRSTIARRWLCDARTQEPSPARTHRCAFFVLRCPRGVDSQRSL